MQQSKTKTPLSTVASTAPQDEHEEKNGQTKRHEEATVCKQKHTFKGF